MPNDSEFLEVDLTPQQELTKLGLALILPVLVKEVLNENIILKLIAKKYLGKGFEFDENTTEQMRVRFLKTYKAIYKEELDLSQFQLHIASDGPSFTFGFDKVIVLSHTYYKLFEILLNRYISQAKDSDETGINNRYYQELAAYSTTADHEKMHLLSQEEYGDNAKWMLLYFSNTSFAFREDIKAVKAQAQKLIKLGLNKERIIELLEFEIYYILAIQDKDLIVKITQAVESYIATLDVDQEIDLLELTNKKLELFKEIYKSLSTDPATIKYEEVIEQIGLLGVSDNKI